MQLFLKRAFDLLVAVFLLVLLSPVMLLLAALVWLEFGRPVLFRQRRLGKNGAPFDLVKFRSMKFEHDAEGNLKPDAERLTGLGTWLRSMSLDELPELFNVLKGEMSLIGPRPLLPEYLPHYTAEEALRHSVRPGITGLAQVAGRNALSWEERLKLDIDYVKHYSFRRDFGILWRTGLIVLRRQGINAAGQATMERLDIYRMRLAREKS